MLKLTQTRTVAGVILAGGLARRMGRQDKGLILYQGQPLISYALAVMQPVVDPLFISANRNLDRYRQWGRPVITDRSDAFDGPLAGVLSAMRHTDADLLLVMPCDCPLASTEHLQVLLETRARHDADAAVAFDGQRLQPVFMAVKTSLQADLRQYLADGGRRADDWLNRHDTVRADFSSQSKLFVNINTMDELLALEARKIAR